MAQRKYPHHSGRSRSSSSRDAAGRVAALLNALRLARDPDAEPRNALPQLAALQRWQGARLARQYADLRSDPQHAKAVDFFIHDLYGADEITWRDRDLRRMLGHRLRAWLPATLLATVANALTLDLVSHEFDLAMAAALKNAKFDGAELDERAYARAYRTVGDRAGREQQIELMLKVGHDLDRIVRWPLVPTLLRIARGPARATGLDRLQGILERGFAAFGAMGGADRFLARIETGERQVMTRLFARHPRPFGSLGGRGPAR